MRREPQPLALVEQWVVQRRQVLELRQQRRRQIRSRNCESRAERASHLLRQALVAPHRTPLRQRIDADGNVLVLVEETLELLG